MTAARLLAPFLLALAPVARAQTGLVDFDGLSRRGVETLPSVPKPKAPRRPHPAPAPAPAPADPSSAPAGPSGSVSFHGVSLPARAFSRIDRVPDSLVAAIDATRQTLRVAIYELTLPGVADALVRAKSRGVDVKLIYDEGHGSGAGAAPGAPAALAADVSAAAGSQPGIAAGPSAQFSQVVNAGIETRLLKGGGAYGIMHNKIAVFDGELVETGSFNWTTAADQANFENALFRDDASLASLYNGYFDWMWQYARPINAGVAQAGSAPQSSFGAPPSDPSPSVVYKGQSWPRASFSPNGGTEARLAQAISQCSRTLDVAIFSFYSKSVADAVVAAKNRGVAVRVVGDVSQARRSPQIAQLIAAGVALKLSAGRGGRGVLHHKFALLDGEMLATGSFNFSENAEANNFENQFYTTDGDDLSAYQAEFEAVWAQAHDPQPGEAPAAPAGVAAR